MRAKVVAIEQAVPQGFGFPSPRRALEGEHGHPGEQVKAARTMSSQMRFWS